MNIVLETVKLASGMVVGIGTGGIVGNAVNLVMKDSEAPKYVVKCAQFTSGIAAGLIAMNLQQHIENQIDTLEAAGRSIMDNRRLKKEQKVKEGK